MKAYIVFNPEPQYIAYSTLKAACKAFNVSYSSAVKGKRGWMKGSGVVMIREIEIEKTKRKPNKLKP